MLISSSHHVTVMTYREPHICFACAIFVCAILVWRLFLLFSQPSLNKKVTLPLILIHSHVLQTFSLLQITISLKHGSQTLIHLSYLGITNIKLSMAHNTLTWSFLSFSDAWLWLCMTPTSSSVDLPPCWEFPVLYLCSWFIWTLSCSLFDIISALCQDLFWRYFISLKPSQALTDWL